MRPERREGWKPEFEVFYDGDCPLCMREIRFLRSRDAHSHRIQFTDIAAPGFDPADVGVDYSSLMGTIHGRLPSGKLVTGVEVFRRLYDAVGFSSWVKLSRLPGISQALAAAYWAFAKNRLRLTRRKCDEDRCAV